MNSDRIIWLEKAYNQIRKDLIPEAPKKINISYGFPAIGHLRSKNRIIGEHWSGFSNGKFISLHPLLGRDAMKLLEVLVHEMIHTAYPHDGHRGNFPKVAKRVGLIGKMTSTFAGPELKECLNDLLGKLGPFPEGHGDLIRRNKQRARLIKLVCECPRIIRTSRYEMLRGPIRCQLCGKEYKSI